MNRESQQKIKELKNIIRKYVARNGQPAETRLLEIAFHDIDTLYLDQNRVCGDPVVLHSLRIGQLLCQVNSGVPTVIAGLLHDLVEDTDMDLDLIQERYGSWYADALDALCKEQTQNQTHQKLLRAGRRDVRFLVIKTFDRLDNMRDIQWLPRDKRTRISQETKEFYLPIAKSIGISPSVINELTIRSNQNLF
jgi:GTP diphosphokinase / guanosine-3',5'-bis(diphosphate) 3'-diphosphatase